MKRLAVVFIAAACLHPETHAQQKTSEMQFIKGVPTICYASVKDEFTNVGPPDQYLKNKSGRIQSTNIEVTYEGFTPTAQAAFQGAVDIWESTLSSPVIIRIHARWTPLGTGVLGAAGPASYVRNFSGAPKQNVWYPVALAENIAGKDLNNTTEYDIEATFNSVFSAWHYGLLGDNPPGGEYDLMSVVLHEIGHGLGIIDAYTVSGGLATIPSYYSGTPSVFETNVIDNNGKNLVNDFTLPSSSLASSMTSGLNFSSPLVRSVNSNKDAILFTPHNYDPGSSVAHLDETTYPAGNSNSLMTPYLGSAERILSPGLISFSILREMGWSTTNLEHTPLHDTESSATPFHIVVKIESVPGYKHNSVTLTSIVGNGAPNMINMTATANEDEYAADIPASGSDFRYSISVATNDLKTLVIPGPSIKPGHQPQDNFFSFHAGLDAIPPTIQTGDRESVSVLDDLNLQAYITDNIGVDNVKIQWKVNNVAKTDVEMDELAPHQYYATIDNNNYHVGDTIYYLIRAEDDAIANNVSVNPQTGYRKVLVTGFGNAKNSYANKFADDLSFFDFDGDGVTAQGYIQLGAPYTNDQDLTLNLKTPIRVASHHATMSFDEIVLVEPGVSLKDYVIVEASADGSTWIPLADGYNSSYNPAWVYVWNRSFDGQNSSAKVDPPLFSPHTFNLLNSFNAGDEIVVRFRLHSDEAKTGWGWAIDNLAIQTDIKAPTVRHQHVDFVIDTAKFLPLKMKVNDPGGLKTILVTYVRNNSSKTQEIIVKPTQDEYTSIIDLTSMNLASGGIFVYRINAIDSSDNQSLLPNGPLTVNVISHTQILNTATQIDLRGNYFNVSGTNAESNHPYQSGYGPDNSSELTLVTRSFIKVSSTNPKITYEDVALVEYNGSDVKDFVVVEGSKDGVKWESLINPYSGNATNPWKQAYDNNVEPGNGVPPNIPHTIDITGTGKFAAGDTILLRFRLHSDSIVTGWGWDIRKLKIQPPLPTPPVVAGLEDEISNVQAWPNPASGNSLFIKLSLPAASNVSVEMINTQGQILSSDTFTAPQGNFQREYDVSNWSGGLYIMRTRSDFGTSVQKIIRLNSRN